MTPSEFAHGYFSEPVQIADDEKRAVELWCWYYVTSEAYDRTACTGGVGPDGILPANPRERALINANASRASREIARVFAAERIDIRTVRRAQEVALRMSDAEQARVAVGPK